MRKKCYFWSRRVAYINSTGMTEKNRRPRFSFNELNALTNEVSKNTEVIFAKISSTFSTERKRRAWRSIAKKVYSHLYI